MDTPSQIFGDDLGIDGGGECYDGVFGDDRGDATLDQSYTMFADRAVSREAPFPSASKLKMSGGMDMWDAIEESTEIAEPALLQQPRFFGPGLYPDGDDDPVMTLGEHAMKTRSQTPELMRSGSRLKSASSSSNSLSATTNPTPPDPEPPRKRTRSKKVKNVAPEDDKRNKFLERNRVAASKCREKKKEFVSKLEETKITLERKHHQLQMDYNSLVSEVGTLKHELMTHAKCDDPNIDRWLAIEAARFVNTSDFFGHKRGAAAAQARAARNNPYPFHTRHSSSSSIQHGAGLGSFSSAGTGVRRDSLGYSQGTSFDCRPEDPADKWAASSAQPSPTDMAFPTFSSPNFGSKEAAINFDHMPDDLFDTEQ